MFFFHMLALFCINSVHINCRMAPHQPFNETLLCMHCFHNPPFLLFTSETCFVEAACLLCYTSFSDELADRSTSWASKNSETDSDMESRLSLEACWVRGIPICSSACRQTHANTEDDSVYESVIIQNWPDPKTSPQSNSGFDFAARVTFPEGKPSVSNELFFSINPDVRLCIEYWSVELTFHSKLGKPSIHKLQDQ